MTFRVSAVFAAVGILVFAASPASAQEYGSIEGQFVFDGAVPERAVLFEKAGSKKDPEVCSAQKELANDLLINAESKGIKNIFFWIRKVKSVHPDLIKPEKPELIFDQKGCRFSPKAMVVRTSQKVRVLSNDPVVHNTHTNTLKNPQVNILIGANDRKGQLVAVPKVELLPTKVNCDLHPHMIAHWLIIDHPYAVVTDKDGKFKIENVPVGKHKMRAWHGLGDGWYVHKQMPKVKDGSKTNYTNDQRYITVTVKAGKTTKLQPVKITPAMIAKAKS